MASKKKPTTIGFSCGDPNGIGAEILVKVFSDPRMFREATPVLYATPNLVEAALEVAEVPEVNWAVIPSADEAKQDQINVVSIQDEPWEIQWGEVDAAAGSFAMKALEAVVNDLASTKVDVLVTLPIHKEAMRQGAFKHPGHTEYLADFANVDEVLMLLVSGDLRVGMCTGHVALKDVSAILSSELIIRKTRLMHDSLSRDFGIPQPRIAVLGLNPHASDNGLMGDEEKRIIAPAIRELSAEGRFVMGPYPADGFFGAGTHKQFDGVLAMYHDQGLAPFKALSFGNGVNFTAGLPIVRTSPDHGTGFDIAGKGLASEDSLRAAIYLARDIRSNRIDHRKLTENPLTVEVPKKKERY
jgi:4-hydroxythreonine-4-phosphate dehydrogenase